MSRALRKITKAIQAKRESLKLSKSQLAERLSLGRNFLHDVESGKETAQIGKVLAYADGLGLKISIYDDTNPLKPLEDAILAASKVDKSLANRLIATLSEDEKNKIKLPQVQIRRSCKIKQISLSV